jgi:hypothetical protein
LECIPFPDTLELIQVELQRIVEPIPSRPPTVAAIRFTAPQRSREEETDVEDDDLMESVTRSR